MNMSMRHVAAAYVFAVCVFAFTITRGSALVRVHLKAKRRRVTAANLLQASASHASSSLNPSGSHATVLLDQRRQSQYLGQVSFGDPPQMFNVLWDTGSSNTWIWSRRCITYACTSKNRFNDALSRSYKAIEDQVINVRYGSGSIDADMGMDSVTVGDGTDTKNSITIRDQTFGQVYDETGQAFDITDMDGIIGLAFPSMSPTGADPIFDSMMKQGLLERPIFAFAFYGRAPSIASPAGVDADSHDMTGAAAVLTFGSYEPERFTGPLMPVSVQGTRYWEVKMLRIKIDGVPVGGICNNPAQDGCKVAIDSGTSGITAPSNELQTLKRALKIDPRCNNFDLLPTLSFEMARAGTDGKRVEDIVALVLEPKDYVQRRSTGWNDDSTVCSSIAVPLDVPRPRGPLWVLGDAFLRVYYTVFDRGQHTVSFAKIVKKEHVEDYHSFVGTASEIVRNMPLLRSNVRESVRL